MTTKIRLLLCCLLSLTMGLFARVASAQEFDDINEVGAYGYTTISYDPNTDVVTAYSETDLYGPATYYYQAELVLTSNGHTISTQSPNPSVTWTNASFAYQGAAGNTYYAQGVHSAYISIKYQSQAYDDYYGFEQWQEYDEDVPWQFPFTAFSEDTDELPQISLGTTYDYAQASIPASCGTGDPRTTMIQEYVSYNTPYFPQCSEFTQSITDPNFTFAQLNYGTYTWAILRSYFLMDIDSLNSLTTFTIQSAYRNPARESVVAIQNGGKYYAGSRHQYGDALDVVSTMSTWSTYQTLGHQLKACVEPIKAQGGLYTHAHLDWRKQATVGPKYTNCPQLW